MSFPRSWCGPQDPQLFHREDNQAVRQAVQSPSFKVFKTGVGKALTNLVADPALSWRLDRDQPELS